MAFKPGYRARKIAQDQSLESSDALGLVRVLLAGLAPDEAAAFKEALLQMLTDDTEAEAPGADRRQAHDARPPRGLAPFSERFPNASRIGVQSVLGASARR